MKEEIDRAVAIHYVYAAQLGFLTWFEFANSKANWADGISRRHADDPFAKEHGFPIVQVDVPQGMRLHDIEHVWGAFIGVRSQETFIGKLPAGRAQGLDVVAHQRERLASSKRRVSSSPIQRCTWSRWSSSKLQAEQLMPPEGPGWPR